MRNPGGDGPAGARAGLKLRLPGPSDPPSRVRIGEAALGLCEVADEHHVRMMNRLLPAIPAQRGAGRTEAAAKEAGPEDLAEPLPEA
ncbi:hypothetical protein OG782_11725 [Streptomyces sp. NBC_00876]|uniref:hypothetical protein n=1 Tax=Streptomyces sp. NBC_00876 TaxID=2975853 RepID=UPI00386D4E46|nr:hypothetical protein OG782_11725 [Streptomyces sp. NBC_00876]